MGDGWGWPAIMRAALVLLVRAGAGSAGPVEAAVGWSDSHPQREVMESDVQLTVIPSQLEQPARGVPWQTPVDAGALLFRLTRPTAPPSAMPVAALGFWLPSLCAWR